MSSPQRVSTLTVQRTDWTTRALRPRLRQIATNWQLYLLILPVFQDRAPGPGVAEVQQRLGADLVATLAEHRVTGKLGDVIVMPTLGRLKSTNLMVVGLGPKASADAGAVRRAAMKAGRAATKFATVATTLAQVGSDAEESAHALAYVTREGKRGTIDRDALVVINLSGRGDKDLDAVAARLGRPI